MQESERIFKAIAKVTGISKQKMLSRSRVWPNVEARMLFVLFCSRRGYNDQHIALILSRARVTILKIRHNAKSYISVSKSFHGKYDQISRLYEKSI